jgi:hypothetical protein
MAGASAEQPWHTKALCVVGACGGVYIILAAFSQVTLLAMNGTSTGVEPIGDCVLQRTRVIACTLKAIG